MTRPPLLLLPVAAAGGLILLFSLHADAEPMRVKPMKVPDEALGLAGIDRLRLVVDTLPPELVDMRRELEEMLREDIVHAGIELTTSRDAPRLQLQLQTSRSHAVPDGLAVGFVLVVYEPVRVERTDRRLILPSFSVSGVKQTTEDAAHEVVRKDVRLMIRFVMTLIEAATEVEQRREEAE